MTKTSERRTPAIVESVRDILQRPLASYQIVLGITGLLLAIGLIMVLSSSSVIARNTYGTPFHMVMRQGLFALVGLIGMAIVLRMPIKRIRMFALPALIVVTGLILLTFTPLGLDVRGNRNWLPLFAGINLQPSELAKLAMVLWIADLYVRRDKYLGTPRYIITPMVPVTGVVAALVVAQQDLGTALVLFAIIVGMLWVAGLPGRHLAVLGVALAVALVFFVATAQHRISRMFNFLDPWADPEGAGHQSIKAMMGFARGGIQGLGLGASRQKWGALPEAHNDFILAIIGEELGLAGSLVVLGLFASLGFVGFRIASRSRDKFAKYAAAGITIWLMAQTTINIGMVLGLLPVIGVPLPLISYGGSSLSVTLVALGVLAKCATTEPGAASALAASRRRRSRAWRT